MIELGNSEFVSDFQIETIDLLNSLIKWDEVNGITTVLEENIGNRGDYINKLNLCIVVKFEYKKWDVEFYISYDQLEYYILRKGKIVYECNIEDGVPESNMKHLFLNSLRKSFNSLND